ncbi:MAG TPA: CvpA family protein [Burkholderiales bacterium]|jgi:membrane protein required for colicin V production|nr:CvpA family protein [Burkholderiales bacterium]
MTWFDFGVLIVLVASVVISLFHGLAREMVSLGVWVGGFILATFFGGYVAGYLPQSLGPLLSALMGFLLVFAGVLMIGWIAGLALTSAVRAAGLGPADRALGSVFGLVRGLIIVLVAVLLAGLTPLPRESFWREAALSGPFETAALALRPYLPAGLAQRLKYR